MLQSQGGAMVNKSKKNLNAEENNDDRLRLIGIDGAESITQRTAEELTAYFRNQVDSYAELLDPNVQSSHDDAQKEWTTMNEGVPENATKEVTDIIDEWAATYRTPEMVCHYYKKLSPTVFKIINKALDGINEPHDAEKYVNDPHDVTLNINKWFLMRDALRDEVERRKQAKEQKRENSKLPAVVRFQTSPEIIGSLRAISDGADLRNWERSKSEVALIHSIPNKKHETKLTGLDADSTYDLLENQLKEVSEPECALQSQFVYEAVLTHERAYLELDYLIRELGWKPRTVAERQKMRETVYKRLCLLSQLSNHGERVEMYKDTLTNKKEKIYGFGKLIYLLDPYFTEQQIQNGDTIPTSVTIVAGDKLNQYRGNRKILQDIGNARRLSGLPTGQAQGDWGVSIGLALNYYWRQDASRVQINRVGEDKLPSPMFNQFTRHQLLVMFPSVKFPVEEILQGDKPHRAQEHWNGAVKWLKKRGVISYTSPAAKLPRQGWQKFWLHEELLDIRPANEARQDVIEIAQAAQKKKKIFAKKPNRYKNS
jgi:hypothetical protein